MKKVTLLFLFSILFMGEYPSWAGRPTPCYGMGKTPPLTSLLRGRKQSDCVQACHVRRLDCQGFCRPSQSYERACLEDCEMSWRSCYLTCQFPVHDCYTVYFPTDDPELR